MANVLATSHLSFRAGGASTNGGYWDSAGGGTDYTVQDAAQLSLTDLTTDGAGTGLGSVVGGFTAAMVGNSINIASGTGFTPGFYRVTAYTSSNLVTIDRSAGAGASAGVGSLGGALDVPTDALLEGNIAGVKCYFQGTITLTENLAINVDGSNTSKILMLGYNTTKDDNPIDANRPTIACGAFNFVLDNGYGVENMIFTGTATPVLRVDVNGYIKNCKATNSSGSANFVSFFLGNTSGFIFDCEAISDSGVGIHVGAGQCHAAGNYVHDCGTVGISPEGSSGSIVGNVIDTCTTSGIGNIAGVNTGTLLYGNTVYNCGEGFGCDGATSGGNYYVNNIIDSNTTGAIVHANHSASNIFDYNNFNNNGTDITVASKGDNATADDPSFTDAASGDFTTTLDANAMPKTDFQGRTTDNSLVQGAVQPASGGEVSYGSVT
jgi:hypothetical protein